MAVSAYAIPTLAEVKAYIGVGVAAADTTLDTVLEGWIDRCSYEVETYCNRKFASQSVSNEILDGDGSNIIYPKFTPIIQLSTETTPTDAQKLAAVQYRSSPDGSWTDIETNVNNLLIDTDWPYIKLYGKSFPGGVQNIRLNYKAGYSVIPGDVWRVALEMVVMMWKRSNRGQALLGKSSKTKSELGASFSEGLLDMDYSWRMTLDRYRVNKRTTSQTEMSR